MKICFRVASLVILFLLFPACSHRTSHEVTPAQDQDETVLIFDNLAGVCQNPENGMDHDIVMEEIRVRSGNTISIKVRNDDTQSIFLPKKAHFHLNDGNAGGIGYGVKNPISDDLLGDFIEVPANTSKEYTLKVSDYFPDSSHTIKPILSLESLEIQGYYKRMKLKTLGKPTYLREGENTLPKNFSFSYSFEKWMYSPFSLKYSKRYVQPKIIVEQ